jgi:hypothetical protein
LPTSTQAQRQFEEEERAYWQNRDALMERYAGKWVAVVGGQVVASGDQMNKVAAEAWRKTGSGVMYVSLVGQEDVVFARATCTGPIRFFLRAADPAVEKRDKVEFGQA